MGLSGGTIRAWGYNYYGQIGDGTTSTATLPKSIDPSNKYIQIATGDNHTCGITLNNDLKCWGKNTYGQLGDGTNTNRLVPTLIDSGVKYSFVSLGNNHTCGITTLAQGQILKCWGRNSTFELGLGVDPPNNSTDPIGAFENLPQIVDTGISYLWVATSNRTTCGITTSNKLKCWGDNNYGQIGDGTTTDKSSPVPIDTNTDYIRVSLGSAKYGTTGCGITTTGILKCWGASFTGALGVVLDRTSTSESLPKVVDANESYMRVDVGEHHTCGITQNNVLKCWGTNTYGQLGILPSIIIPTAVNNNLYSKIATGRKHTCAITTSGVMQCMGDNYYGQLGNQNSSDDLKTPVAADSSETYSKVAVTDYSTCGITNLGVLKCWGRNNYGQITGGTISSLLPVVVSAGTTFTEVTAGDLHACAITTSGALFCWGDNNYYQLGDSNTALKSTPFRVDGTELYSKVSSEYKHTCGITTGGVLKCWGYNSNGQIGNNNVDVSQNYPVAIDGNVKYVNVAVGYKHTCGITDTKVLKCWGANYSAGALGDGGTTDKYSPIVVDPGVEFVNVTAGSGFTCAVTTGATMKCWGSMP
jgi:alpha-tubulin suppressor-like RCC1 family protein